MAAAEGAAPVAAEVRLTPILKDVTDISIDNTLSKFCQIDAHHDFDGVELDNPAAPTKKSTYSFFKTAKETKLPVKDILGIPNAISLDKLSEINALEELFTIKKDELKPTEVTSKSFFETFRPNMDLTNYDSADKVTFKIGEYEYNVKTLRVFTKKLQQSGIKHKKEKIAGLTAEMLYNWLDVNGNKHIAFGIDAQNVPFYEYFETNETAFTEPKKAEMLKTREEFIDAATKLTLKEINVENFVFINNEKDNENKGIITYPASTEVEAKHMQLYSNYTVNLFPIQTIQKIPNCGMELIDKSIRYPVNIVKGSAEDSHVNSVPALAKRMFDMLSNLFTKKTEKKSVVPDKSALQSYFTRKRAGDWLQVLSCLQPERFGLSPHIRPFLVTLDRVCLAYGILMGADMVYTTQITNQIGTDTYDDYWLVFFHRVIETRTPYEKMDYEIKELDRTIQSLIGSIRSPVKPDTYERLVGTYITIFQNKIVALNKEISDTIALLGTPANPEKRFKGDDFEKKIRLIMYVYMKLAIFRSTIPILQGTFAPTAADPTVYTLTPDPFTRLTTEFAKVDGNIIDDEANKTLLIEKTNALAQVNQNINNIRSIITKLSKPEHGVSTAYEADFTQALTQFFDLKFKANVNINDIHKILSADILETITKMTIFPSQNAPPTSSTTGPALFTYLNESLLEDEKSRLIKILVSQEIPDVTKRSQYQTFLRFASLLTGITNPAININFSNIKNSTLIVIIDKSDNGETINSAGAIKKDAEIKQLDATATAEAAVVEAADEDEDEAADEAADEDAVAEDAVVEAAVKEIKVRKSPRLIQLREAEAATEAAAKALSETATQAIKKTTAKTATKAAAKAAADAAAEAAEAAAKAAAEAAAEEAKEAVEVAKAVINELNESLKTATTPTATRNYNRQLNQANIRLLEAEARLQNLNDANAADENDKLKFSEGTPLQADSFKDFYTAHVILARRAGPLFNERLTDKGQQLGIKQKLKIERRLLETPQEGGEVSDELNDDELFQHSPLTTFYFFLRDLSFRLTYDDMGEDYMNYLVQVSKFINYCITSIPQRKNVYTFLQIMEVIFMEYLHTGSYFQEYSSELEQIQTHFKKTYYGHLHVVDMYQQMLMPESIRVKIPYETLYKNYLKYITDQFISEYPEANVSIPIESRVSEQIVENQLSMRNIIKLLQEFEEASVQTIQPKQTMMMKTGLTAEERRNMAYETNTRPQISVYGGNRRVTLNRRSTLKRHVGKQTRGRKYKHRKSSRKHRGYKNKTTRKHR